MVMQIKFNHIKIPKITCKHPYGFTLIDDYYRIYQCQKCWNYFVILMTDEKGYTYFAWAHVDFSDNDNRIVNIWSPQLIEFCSWLPEYREKYDKKYKGKIVTQKQMRSMYAKKSIYNKNLPKKFMKEFNKR